MLSVLPFPPRRSLRPWVYAEEMPLLTVPAPEPVGLTLPNGELVPSTILVFDEERSRSEKDELRVAERPRHGSVELYPSFENDHDRDGSPGGVRPRDG